MKQDGFRMIEKDGEMVKQRIFKDLFNREIRIGDKVLNVWANDDKYREMGEGEP